MPIVCDMSSDIFSRVLDFQSSISYMLDSKKYGSCWNYISYRKEEILGKSGRVIQVYWIMKSISKQKACTIHLLYFQSMLLY
jgi:phosphoserine aminotransferase